MTLEIEKLLDDTGWQLLTELQQNARLSYSELGQRVGLSSPAVADRMRKMEEAGIISGYHARINLARVGLPVTAIIRLTSTTNHSCNRVFALASELPEVLECYRVTGNDSVVVKVVANSVEHLSQIIDQMSTFGLPSTSIVLTQFTTPRTITRSIIEHRELAKDGDTE